MKFAGKIGFEIHSETKPGVWEPTIVEKFYRGNIEQELTRHYSGSDINKNYSMDNRIRIVADPFSKENYSSIRFVEHLGTAWEVKTIDVREYPHMYLYLGGVYNGPRSSSS